MIVTSMVIGIAGRCTTSPGGGETALDNLEQVAVLQRSLHSFLVVQLLVHSVLRLMRALFDS